MLSTNDGMKHIEVDKTISFLWVEPFLRLIYMVTKDISDKRTSRSDEVGFQDDIGPIDQSETEGTLSTQEAVDMNSTAAKRLGSRKRKQVVSDLKRHKEFGVEVEIGFQKNRATW